jgi:hypothetical protein
LDETTDTVTLRRVDFDRLLKEREDRIVVLEHANGGHTLSPEGLSSCCGKGHT